MSSLKKVRVTRPPGQLDLLVKKPGGLPRHIAIARSEERLESQRAPALLATRHLVDALELLVARQPGMEALPQLRRLTDELISLATIFDMPDVVAVGTRLSGLAEVCSRTGCFRGEAVAVHIGALALFTPPSQPPEGAAARILQELDSVLAHLAVPRA